MKKRLIAGLICLCMLFSLIPAFTLSASAVTFSQVVSWMDSKKGKTLDYDGQYGGQCVDLFNFYLRDVWGVSNPIGAYPVGSAYQIFDYKAPSGWEKISGAGNYRVGDVVIWNKGGSSTHGHVGIVYSVSGSSVSICQQNYNKMQYVTMQPIHSTGTIRGVFRPPLQNDTPKTVKATQVVAWIDSKKGQALDYDGSYGAQSPDLFNYYVRDIWGISNPISAFPVSYSYQYFDYNAPSGWQKISGSGNYRVGDIVIWNKSDGYSNGYVGIVYSVNGSDVKVAQQNYGGKQYVTLESLQNTGNIRGVFRPPLVMDIANYPSPSSGVTISDGKYILQNVGSGYIFNYAVGGLSGVSGYKPIIMSKPDNSPEQTFQIKHVGSGKYNLLVTHSDGGAVNIYRGTGNPQAGDPVSQWSYSGSEYQQFYITPVSGGYILQSVLDPSFVIATPSNDWHAQLKMVKYDASDKKQVWTFTSLTPAAPSSKPASEVIAWMDSKKGQALDYDGVYGPQSPDLFDFYMHDVWGVTNPLSSFPISNAYEIFNCAVPAGWEKISGAGNYRVGDVVVWGQNDNMRYGHVGIIYSVDGSSVVICQQNYNNQQYVTMNSIISTGNILGVLRPPVVIDTVSYPSPASAQTLAPGKYILKNVGTGYIFNYAYGGFSGLSYKPIIMSNPDGSPEQTFQIKHVGNGKYNLLVTHSDGGAVNIYRGSGNPQGGDPVTQWCFSGSEYQQFFLTPVEGGYLLQSVLDPSMVVTAPNADWHAQLQMAKYRANDQKQVWKFTAVADAPAGSITFDRVVNWMNSKRGKALDYDGKFGAQCVDLINFYLRDVFGIKNPIGVFPVDYAYQMFDYNAPSGWQKISGAGNYRVGDIVVWNKAGSNTTGHVGIVYSVNGGSVVICQQNYSGMQYVTMQNIHSTGTIRGVFRPPLVDGTKLPDVEMHALVQAIAEAESMEENKDDYTEASVTALEEAIVEGKNASDSGDQEAINAAAMAIETVIKEMKLKTDAGAYRFVDVSDTGKFFFEPVYWAFDAEPQITNGVDETHFGPDRSCTRGQVVTFLWRAAGCPEPDDPATPFTDVKSGAFYEMAVAWAVENGITNGMTDTTFAPDATCTRGQIVTFLWRANGSSRVVTAKNPFTDVSNTAYYYPAMLWAVEYGVTAGISETAFAPNNTCTRGQVVTFLYRASQIAEISGFKAGSYEIVISNATWDEAFAYAKSKGGKLVSFDSKEEYLFVLGLIDSQDLVDNVFYSLGGRRDDGSDVYCWTDADNKLSGNPITGDSAWCGYCWEPGEPNLVWNDSQETVAMMYYDKNEARWAWCDGASSTRIANRTYAYIIEYPT